jgi:hypothetical protein
MQAKASLVKQCKLTQHGNLLPDRYIVTAKRLVFSDIAYTGHVSSTRVLNACDFLSPKFLPKIFIDTFAIKKKDLH